MEKLNSIINIDLHIHSSLSGYKEEPNYVSNSNVNNIDVLLEKLNKENINMFSITDHNRFSFELFSKLKEKISNNEYENVKNILPGIEFDVQIEEYKESCHIICIFDDSNDAKIQNIEKVLNDNGLLTGKDDYYSKNQFEKILKEIDVNVILIAHQHKHFDQKNGGKRSISNSVSNIYEFIKTGYINALEYQKPVVQGMIINSLKKVNKNVATIIGSDCHKWECYPQKDENTSNKDYVSKIKALPNFRGLVFAFTSMETRFNRLNNNNKNYIKYIKCNNEYYELSNGLNAIIGDNGSGKTFLLDMIYNENLKPCYKELKRINDVDIIIEGSPEIEYIRQNQIIDDVKDGKLFNNYDTEYYKLISTKETFKKRIKTYSENLIKNLQENIIINNQKENLKNVILELKESSISNFVPIAKIDLKVSDNDFEDRISTLEDIMNSLKDEYSEYKSFYNKNAKELNFVIKNLKGIITKLKEKNEDIIKKNEIKNSIISALDNFNINMGKDRTDKEKEDLQYKSEKSEFCESIIKVIKNEKKERRQLKFPPAIKGSSRKLYKGFNFSKQAKYDNLDLEDLFYDELFTKGYTKKNIFDIKTMDEFINCLSGITRIEDLSNWHKKVDNFIDKYSHEETFIEKKSSKETMGNTPGEISIVFYDFKLNNSESEKTVLLIDQPEDDISNNKISKQLISYIEQIRDKKQIILVTHNPLLVVNLDVDNVVVINKNFKKELTLKNGCLEYEENNYRIIDEIAESMDGGKDIIERRFKLYENYYNRDNI